MKKKQKPYWEMTPAELQEATKEFDREIDPKRLKPLSPKMRAIDEKMRAGPSGSMFVPRGRKKKLTIEIDDVTLTMIDDFAKRKGLTRNELLDRGLRSMLAFVA